MPKPSDILEDWWKVVSRFVRILPLALLLLSGGCSDKQIWSQLLYFESSDWRPSLLNADAGLIKLGTKLRGVCEYDLRKGTCCSVTSSID